MHDRPSLPKLLKLQANAIGNQHADDKLKYIPKARTSLHKVVIDDPQGSKLHPVVVPIISKAEVKPAKHTSAGENLHPDRDQAVRPQLTACITTAGMACQSMEQQDAAGWLNTF